MATDASWIRRPGLDKCSRPKRWKTAQKAGQFDPQLRDATLLQISYSTRSILRTRPISTDDQANRATSRELTVSLRQMTSTWREAVAGQSRSSRETEY